MASHKNITDGAHNDDSVTVKIPKSVVYIVAATLILAAAYTIGSTIKERVTDPVLEKTEEVGGAIVEEATKSPAERAQDWSEEEAQQKAERQLRLSLEQRYPLGSTFKLERIDREWEGWPRLEEVFPEWNDPRYIHRFTFSAEITTPDGTPYGDDLPVWYDLEEEEWNDAQSIRNLRYGP